MDHETSWTNHLFENLFLSSVLAFPQRRRVFCWRLRSWKSEPYYIPLLVLEWIIWDIARWWTSQKFDLSCLIQFTQTAIVWCYWGCQWRVGFIYYAMTQCHWKYMQASWYSCWGSRISKQGGQRIGGIQCWSWLWLLDGGCVCSPIYLSPVLTCISRRVSTLVLAWRIAKRCPDGFRDDGSYRSVVSFPNLLDINFCIFSPRKSQRRIFTI